MHDVEGVTEASIGGTGVLPVVKVRLRPMDRHLVIRGRMADGAICSEKKFEYVERRLPALWDLYLVVER